MSDDLSIPSPGYRGRRAGRYGTGPARPPRGMDPDTRRLVMFAGGLGAVLVAVIGASALIGHHGGDAVPIVSPDPRPIREKPANPGGMKIDSAENDVFSGGTDTAGAKLAAQPETPDTKALHAAETSPPPPAAHAAAAPSVAPAPAARPASQPPIAAAPPAPPAHPRAAQPTGLAAVAAKPPQAAAGPVAAHQPMVQFAALTSEQSAHAEWRDLRRKFPDLLGNRQPAYSRVEHDGHVYWRVRTAGFADLAQARGFCEHVRAKGSGCSVADF